ncbi:MAG TPA: tyrosine-type recombinase/integrase [Rhodanobacteraceae bacterium]
MGGKATITTVSGQDALPVRSAVHWHKLHTGQHVGLRKTKTAQTWYARAYDGAKQVRHALGSFDHLPRNERFSAASKVAEDWFKGLDAGGPARPITVLEACERHVQSLRDDPDKGDVAADAVAGYVRRFVASDKIAGIAVDKLKRGDVADWRKRMERKPAARPKRGKHCRNNTPLPPSRKRAPASINRNMVFLRAALRQALAEGYALTDHAWTQPLKPIKAVNGRRERYLSREERQRLIAHAREDAQPFLRALAELPLRVGALAALHVGDYDKRNKLLTIRTDKAGAGRTIPLPATAATLIEHAARRKLPTAPLFARWDGEPWTATTWKDAVRNAVEAADLPRDVVAYTLRHCAIADLITAGCDLNTVATISGTSLQMIAKHYGKLRQDIARDALAGLAL